MSVRKLNPGQAIRVESNATVIGLVNKDNPYWYTIVHPSGETEVVSLARINAVVDHCRAVINTDCSIQIFLPRLSASGALDLLLWLETHRHEFEQATMPPVQEDATQGIGYPPDGSNYHDHLCRCPGCDPQPPDEA